MALWETERRILYEIERSLHWSLCKANPIHSTLQCSAYGPFSRFLFLWISHQTTKILTYSHTSVLQNLTILLILNVLFLWTILVLYTICLFLRRLFFWLSKLHCVSIIERFTISFLHLPFDSRIPFPNNNNNHRFDPMWIFFFFLLCIKMKCAKNIFFFLKMEMCKHLRLGEITIDICCKMMLI